MALIDNFTKEQLQQLVQESYSYRELLPKLGYKTTSGNNNQTVKKRLKEFNISTEHFSLNGANNTIRTKENVFCINSTASQATLRRWFIKEDYIPYKCDCCGISEWQNKKLSLQLDHKNGDNHDNRLENLHWLCPNCHSQTDTFCGKQKTKSHATKNGTQIKIKTINYCIDCGKEIYSTSTRCDRCEKIHRRIVNRPSREELKNLIRTISFTKIGEQFGVSDNAIRKWCDAYNLPRKVSEIKKYTDEEWLII